MSKSKKQDVVTIEQPVATLVAQPASLIMLQSAIEKGMDPEKLLQFYEIHEKFEANEARKAYAVAMVATQKEIPVIPRDCRNSQTSSSYSSHEQILEIITPIYTRHGLSLTFFEEKADTEGFIRTVCEVLHESGHIRKYYNDLPLDNAGIKGSVNKTPMHATGSSKTYGRRYLTLMIFNIGTGDDTDGNLTTEARDKRQAIELQNAIHFHSKTISAICEGIAIKQLDKAVEAKMELSNDELSSINISPTRAAALGVEPPFTTNQISIMKSDEWSAEVRKYFADKNS